MEKRVKSLTSDIDGGDAGRSENHMFFGSGFGYITQKGRFTCAGLSGKENRVTGRLDQRQGSAELAIIEIYA